MRLNTWARRFSRIGLAVALFAMTSAEMCGDPCVVGDGSDDIKVFIGATNMPNDVGACYDDTTKKHSFSFDQSVTELNLEKTMIIGEYNKPSTGSMEINVGGQQIIVRPKDNFTMPYQNCVIAILRDNVVLENFKFEGFPTDSAICIAHDSTGTILNKMDFTGVQKPIILFQNSGVSITNSKFNEIDTEPIRWGVEDAKQTATVTISNNLPYNLCETVKNLGGSNVTCSCNGDLTLGSDYVCQCGEGTQECPAGSGKCVSVCAPNEALDKSSCTCVTECPENEIKKGGACVCLDASSCTCAAEYSESDVKKGSTCVCQEGFGRYQSGSKCVACGESTSTGSANDICICNGDAHIDLEGKCVPDIVKCDSKYENVKPDPVLGVCVCKQCSHYVWDDWKTAPTSLPRCTEPDYAACKPVLDCAAESKAKGRDLVVNADGTACVESVDAGKGGRCGCNLGTEPASAMQMALPYLALAFGGIGLQVWKRKKR